MAPSTLMTHILLVPFLIVILPIISSSQSACPRQCTCDTRRHLVNCRNAGLHHVPWDLPDPMGLTHLDLSGNDITEINAQFLYTNLHYLDLSDNKIISITDGVLRDLPHLEELILKNNHLTSIGEHTFADMGSLRKLDLSSNELTSVTRPVFRDLSHLEDLSLSGNLLQNISATTFQGLSSLHYLNLEDNHLSSVSERGLFHELRLLKVLSLGYNQLQVLPSDAFTELNMLRELILEDNSIEYIDNEAFSNIKPTPLSQLERLNLRNNKLTVVPTNSFEYLTSLEGLDLSQNPITQISTGAFRGLIHLRKILINTMPLLELVEDLALSELSNLQELQMHSNHKLKIIVEGAFLDTPELLKVDLHANALQTISINLLNWYNLEHLDLRYNRWHCDCHLAWLPQILRERFNTTSQFLTQEIRCFSPAALAARPIMSLEVSTYPNCSPDIEAITPTAKEEKFQDHIMIAIMCSVGGILIIIIVILMCKYGSSYRTAYAPAMDYYVYRNPKKSSDPDLVQQKVPVIEGSKVRGLRSSLSSVNEIQGIPRKKERRLYRVRFAETSSDQNLN